MSTSEQQHEMKVGAPSGDPKQYDAAAIQNFFQAMDASSVGVAGQKYQQLGGFAALIVSDLDSGGKPVFDQWKGPAAIMAQQALAQLRNTAQQLSDVCNKFGTALDTYGGSVGQYQNMSWPQLSQDKPLTQQQYAHLNQVAQQAMSQVNGHMSTAWASMPAQLTSELPGISNPAGPPGYSTGSGTTTSQHVPTGPSGHVGVTPPGTAPVPPPHGVQPPGTTLPPGTPPPHDPSHLASVPPGLHPGPGTPPPGNTTPLPNNPGTIPPGPQNPGTPPGLVPPGPGTSRPPSAEEPPNAREPSVVPPGEEPPPGEMPGARPYPGAVPGPNTSVEASAPVSEDFQVAGAEAGAANAAIAEEEALGLNAAGMGAQDMLGMPLTPMSAPGIPQEQERTRITSLTEDRDIWTEGVEAKAGVIGDAPNYLGLTGRRPVRAEPGESLSVEELERLLQEAVADTGEQRGHASIPGEITAVLDGIDDGAALPGSTVTSDS